MTPRHAAFVIPHPYVDAIACFREPIKRLADEGWRIDLFTMLSPQHPAPSFNRENVRLVPIEMTRSGLLGFMARIVWHRPKYDWIFAVPQWALYYAGIAASFAKIPIVCLSDELKTDGEATTGEHIRWRRREVRAHRTCAFTIALTEERGAFIREENKLGAAHPIYVVPNSAPGPARRLPSRYYQDTLGIRSDQCVLLNAGSWYWKLGFAHVEQIARGWDGQSVLVFQGRMLNHFPKTEAHPNLRFSSTVLPSDLLDYAVSSAHIGLGLYDTRNMNNRLMGAASGKVTLYMKNALPIILTAHPSFDWVEREGCGVLVDDLRDIAAASGRIRSDYDRYVSNVKRYYAERLDFARTFEPVLARLGAQRAP